MAVRLFVSYACINKDGVQFFSNAEIEEDNEPQDFIDIQCIEEDIKKSNDYLDFVSVMNWKVLKIVTSKTEVDKLINQGKCLQI